MRKWKGYPYPLGATWMGNGVNFAVYSQNATAVELCLYEDSSSSQESHRITLTEREDEVWHIFLPDVKPGQLYGYRVHGPWAPETGARFNSMKVLLDPYAKAITGQFRPSPALFAYELGHQEADLKLSTLDNSAVVPKSVVVDQSFAWGNDRRLRRPIEDTVIYELHVRGFSRLWEKIPENLRGTYAGLAHPEAICYFQQLGVTALELLPIQAHADETFLADRGLTNYWGYNTIGFFAPEGLHSSQGDRGEQVWEFKEMVRALHAAGLEVILDVVYNHTAEGHHLGPSLCFKGLDNSVYYRLTKEDRRYYQDYTGTGNTLNVPHPRVLQLIMDSLRYWVTEMHVDGFRFDLAPALARETHAVSKISAFFNVMHQDPVVSQVKLIAEPWDTGEGGYHVGNFPVLWCEWNGRYRDTIRKFWRGDPHPGRDIAYRLAGSPDLYAESSKSPTASINFVTCHDGYTLADLVAHEKKHNEANGEENRDGENRNHSWNEGVEGPTEDKAILAARRRQRRNLLISLLLSQGVPMLCAGDEAGRTQRGNNNAYCQDNEISWLDWSRTPEQEQFFQFVTRLIKFRLAHPVFHRPKFFVGREIIGNVLKDITWFLPSGEEMHPEDWDETGLHEFGLLLAGDNMGVMDFESRPIRDDTFYLIFNASRQNMNFILPRHSASPWEWIIDSTDEDGFLAPDSCHPSGETISVPAQSVQLFCEKPPRS